MALSQGISSSAIQRALIHFKHVKRRFDEKYYSPESGVRVVDDYGHHPTEVKAVLATARQAGHTRIFTVFQPHRYTRTQLCWNEFLEAFDDTDVLLLLPIYSAGEDPIPGIHSDALFSALRAHRPRMKILLSPTLDDACDEVLRQHLPGDLILTLGAGSITQLGDRLVQKLS
jgi:UDP-N-acetylmuramate--alanine ligase